jgi:hypothetical protein
VMSSTLALSGCDSVEETYSSKLPWARPAAWDVDNGLGHMIHGHSDVPGRLKYRDR